MSYMRVAIRFAYGCWPTRMVVWPVTDWKAATDSSFSQLSSMARDMCTLVRMEAFTALGKIQRVSEGVLLQSLEKKVRRTACKSLGALAKFSTQYTEKALDLLMDMMNDDTEAIWLQALEALFRMATYGCLSVQEKHMHMVLTTNILLTGKALAEPQSFQIDNYHGSGMVPLADLFLMMFYSTDVLEDDRILCDWQDLPFKNYAPLENDVNVHPVTFCFVSCHLKIKDPKKQFLVYGSSRAR
ncbi:hypothetical protein ZEAMMB73_Zm00001d021215, partial [Zea mays]